MAKTKAFNLRHPGITFIMPAYNSAQWIRPTVQKIHAAVARAELSHVEIIIVDDGSSDETKKRAETIGNESDLEITVLSHENRGRFLARKRGVEAAKYGTVFFVDTRVWIDETSLSFILTQQKDHSERLVWNGHVNVAKEGNIIARFMDSVTLIGWRRYFSNPRLVSYGPTDFDYYPKGTGMFLAPKEVLLEAIKWFESVTKDVRNSSDDTLLIRHISERNKIWLSPAFSCTYFARTTLAAFVKHTYFRGQFFVDGFLRPGTRFYYYLIGFLIVTVILPVACIFLPGFLLVIIVSGLLAWLAELAVALALRLNVKDALSLFILTPLFALTYGAGIWVAVVKRIYKK